MEKRAWRVVGGPTGGSIKERKEGGNSKDVDANGDNRAKNDGIWFELGCVSEQLAVWGEKA